MSDDPTTWQELAEAAIGDLRRYADDPGPERRMVSARGYEADAARLRNAGLDPAALTTPLFTGDHFERLVSTVAGLHRTNAKHKRGFRLAEQEPRRALKHALGEVGEAIEADAYGDHQNGGEEVMDAFACLVHYLVMRELPIGDLLEWWATEKMPKDFPEAGVPKPRSEANGPPKGGPRV